jgi:hypothetical protein
MEAESAPYDEMWMEDMRLRSWCDWYRFARQTLEKKRWLAKRTRIHKHVVARKNAPTLTWRTGSCYGGRSAITALAHPQPDRETTRARLSICATFCLLAALLATVAALALPHAASASPRPPTYRTVYLDGKTYVCLQTRLDYGWVDRCVRIGTPRRVV